MRTRHGAWHCIAMAMATLAFPPKPPGTQPIPLHSSIGSAAGERREFAVPRDDDVPRRKTIISDGS